MIDFYSYQPNLITNPLLTILHRPWATSTIQIAYHFAVNYFLVLGKPLDEFQATFQDLRKKSRTLRELVDKRRLIFEREGPKDKNIPLLKQDILKARSDCNIGEQKLKSLLAKKMKKFTPEEV